ncbi:hypothetical protein AB0I60_03170 [Actinosynnema sp. NPDC050436]|uniref:hypothetical protein n=1 Tax=Actinosynnema sp. NPDC050436 TaxID=3155659 RepID=UPI0033CA4C4E
MSALSVVGWTACGPAEAVVDPWVPLTVRWNSGEARGSLTMMVEGTAGGRVELMVDRVDGALKRLVVLHTGPEVASHGDGFDLVAEAPCTPRFDLGPWGSNGSADIPEPKLSAIDTTAELSYSVIGEVHVVRFSGRPAARHMAGGSVVFGLSEEDVLIEVVFRAVQQGMTGIPRALTAQASRNSVFRRFVRRSAGR